MQSIEALKLQFRHLSLALRRAKEQFGEESKEADLIRAQRAALNQLLVLMGGPRGFPRKGGKTDWVEPDDEWVTRPQTPSGAKAFFGPFYKG